MLILMLLAAGALLLFMQNNKVEPGKQPGEPSIIAAEPPVLKKLIADRPAPVREPELLKPLVLPDRVVRPAPKFFKPPPIPERRTPYLSRWGGFGGVTTEPDQEPDQEPDRLICKTR